MVLQIFCSVLAKPLAELYNFSVNNSFVPLQWKISKITPVAKIAKPQVCSEYRPISVTPILSRVLEKLVVQDFVYPVLTNPLCAEHFLDQYAFRPTGSTTAAIVSRTQHIAEMLQTSRCPHHLTRLLQGLRYGSPFNLTAKVCCFLNTGQYFQLVG